MGTIASCGSIANDILLDCDNPIIGGVNDRLILFNYDDIDVITYDVTNPQMVTDLTLASGARGYCIQGKNNSNEPRSALFKGRYSTTYDHEVIFKVFDNNPTIKEELEAMAKGKLVALIQNNHQGASGKGAFELYGLGSGLEAQENETTKADPETQGAYNVILRSSEFAREAHLPNTFFDTDYATTKAKVDALIV